MAVFQFPPQAFYSWKAPVQSIGDLPLLGNKIGDSRVVRDAALSFIWSGSAWISATGTAAVTAASTTNFNNILSSADDTVQKALDTIDNVAAKKSIVDQLVPQQIVTVAKAGAQFTTIQAAINSIVDASSTKQYLVKIAPGVYTENITGKDYVSLEGVTNGAVTVVGTYASTITGSASLAHMSFQFTPTANGQIVFQNNGGVFLFNDLFVNIVGAADFSVTGASLTSGVACTAFDVIVQDRRSGNITSQFLGVSYAGAGTFGVNNVSVSARASYTAGIHVLSRVICTGSFSAEGGVQLFRSSSAFSGTVYGIYVGTVSAQQRVWSNAQITLSTVSGGTSYGMGLDSSGNSAEFLHVGSTIFSSGFTSAVSAVTGITDTQKVWLQSANKDMPIAGNGLAIITPYAEAKSGFVSWSQDPAITTFYTYTAATRLFKVDKRGTGIVKGAPVVWAKDQTVTLTDLVTNFVYMDSSGIIGVQQDGSGSEDKIFLFEILVSGLNFIVCKENHPYKFTTSISSAWHNLFGSLLESSSQTLAINSGANRTANLVGTNVINDHGLTTSVAAQTPMSFNQFVQNTSTSSVYLIAGQAGIVSVKSAANNTGTNVANGRFVNYRIGVIKESLNSSAAQFVCVADNVDYANASAALSAITSNSVLPFPPVIKSLEICQLGFLAVQANGSGGGTLTAVNTQLQVFGAQFVGGGTSTSAALITTDVTNFDTILSATDTSVQLALETIDNVAVKKATSSTDNALARFDGTTGQLIQNSLVTVDDGGVITSSGAGFYSFGNISGTNAYSFLRTITDAGAGASGVSFGHGSTYCNIYNRGGVLHFDDAIVQDKFGSCTAAGAWTLGAAGSGVLHTVNGNLKAVGSVTAASTYGAINSTPTPNASWTAGSMILQSGVNANADNIGIYSAWNVPAGMAFSFAQNNVSILNSSAAGAWTLGASGGTQTHTVNGSLQVTTTVDSPTLKGNTIVTKTASGTFTFANSAAANIGSYTNNGNWTLGSETTSAQQTINGDVLLLKGSGTPGTYRQATFQCSSMTNGNQYGASISLNAYQTTCTFNTSPGFAGATTQNFAYNYSVIGSYSSDGLWTLGASGGSQVHKFNGLTQHRTNSTADGGFVFSGLESGSTSRLYVWGADTTNWGTFELYMAKVANGLPYTAFTINGNSGVVNIGNGGVIATHIVNGSLQVTTRSANSTNVAAYFTSTGVLSTVSSSRRYKKNIEDLTSGLDIVKQMRPVSFDYISEESPSRKMYGMIAEELVEVLPNMVVRNDAGETESIFYQDLPVILLKAMQEQQKQIDEQQRQIELLMAKLSAFSEPV